MITTYLNGRLGNNLFQYIYCRIAAHKNKCNFYTPKNKKESNDLYTLCNKKLGINLPEYDVTNPHYWIGDKLFDLDYGINDGIIETMVGEVNIESVNDKTLLNGFFQSDEYMVGYENLIINDWLRIKDNVKLITKPILEKYDINDYCYIHFRGGDYKNIEQYYLPIQYYENAIKHITSIKKGIKFIIITDDVVEATKFFPNYEIINNDMEIDFYLLTKAKYLIIPNSSFSWWACWLNVISEIIIAPNRWFNYNKNYGDGFEPPKIKTDKFYYL